MKNNRAVTPVVGIILVTAITIILASITAFVVLDYSSQLDEKAPQVVLDSELESNTILLDNIEGVEVTEVLMNGEGTNENHFEVKTASDLQAVNEEPDRNYILLEPVNADNINEEWDTDFEPIGSEEEPFTGSFDGQNNDINNFNTEDNFVFNEIDEEGSIENVDKEIINEESDSDTGEAEVSFTEESYEVQEGETLEGEVDVELNDRDDVSFEIVLNQEESIDEFSVDEDTTEEFEFETSEGEGVNEGTLDIFIRDKGEPVDSASFEIID